MQQAAFSSVLPQHAGAEPYAYHGHHVLPPQSAAHRRVAPVACGASSLGMSMSANMEAARRGDVGKDQDSLLLAGLAAALPEAPPPGVTLTPRSYQRHRASRVQVTLSPLCSCLPEDACVYVQKPLE
jgi:hypothetical protein